MSRPALGPHACNDVDGQPDPQAWVRGLDDLAREPFYASYKRRIGELLDLRPDHFFLDVGGGTGSDASQRAQDSRGRAVLTDRSSTMCAEARRRGLGHVVRADGSALPFRDRSFQACAADRVLQHIADPAGALREMVRITRPGGRIVVADPDYDTQVVDCLDQELARRVLRFRSDHLLRNGSIAHRTPGLLRAAGATDVDVEARVLIVRNPAEVDNVMGLRTWADTACERGVIPAGDAARWLDQFDEAVRSGTFLYAVTFFLTTGRAP